MLWIKTLFCLLLSFFLNLNLTAQEIDNIRLPEGFEIKVFAKNITDPRSIIVNKDGVVFVSSPSSGKVFALIDADKDGLADKQYPIASNLKLPHGLAFFNDALYVAEIDRITRFETSNKQWTGKLKKSQIITGLPKDRHHGYKVIGVGPDRKIYLGIGVPCNVCILNRDKFGVIKRLNLDGSGLETYAYGIRNTVGFDWHPVTGELWFNDHGRDWLGDDLPSDELNHAPVAKLDFGFPYCHQGDIPDPELADKRSCREFVPPKFKHGAHVAPNGLHFYTGRSFPDIYRNSIFIAQHGSWNRSIKSGYKITVIKSKADGELFSEVFAEGWEKNGTVKGRPVDIAVNNTGDLLITDDYAGMVYIIRYTRDL